MKEFFVLEGAYLVIGLIVLIITAFVATRPFIKRGALRKSLIYVSLFFIVAISIHYIVTKNRMNSVKEAFKNGGKILCENRIYTKGANFVTIRKEEEWKLKDDYFTSPNYMRKFFIARCFVE